MIPVIEKHFEDNYKRIVKRMSFRAGTIWAAEDVVMEAYSRAILYIKAFDGTDFDKWFATILHNCLREFKNAEKGHTAVEFDEADFDGVDCNGYNGRIMAQIYNFIQTKTPIQIEILMLYFHQEYNPMDISRMTYYKYSQVHQVILRFTKELKEMYK